MKKSLRFIILTCAVSWLAAQVAFMLGLRKTDGFAYTIFGSGYMLLPMICALILQALNREKPFRKLNVSFKPNLWFLTAGLTPFALALLTIGINLLFPGVSFSASYEGFISSLPPEIAEQTIQQLSRFSPAVFLAIQLGGALFAGYTINAVFAFGEELGWRGYLLRELKNRKFFSVSLITGAVWGIWHFPLILIGHNYPKHPAAGVGMMVIFCILLSPLLTYITIKAKSVIAAAVFHGSLNAIGGIGLLYLSGGNDLTNGITGAAGFTALLLLNLIFFIYDKFITKENIFTKKAEESINF